jgi:DNA-binding MarR family transcriptional regulator
MTATDTALASELRTTMTLGPIAALGSLDRHGPMAPSELAALERVQPPSMTRILAKLEEAGLVTREPHPTDRRQVVVAVSAAGKEMLHADRRRRDAWLAQRMRDLTSDEREVLRQAAAVLDKLAGS